MKQSSRTQNLAWTDVFVKTAPISRHAPPEIRGQSFLQPEARQHFSASGDLHGADAATQRPTIATIATGD